jgi:putative membrane protein
MTTLAQAWCDGNGPGAWWPIFPVTFWTLVLIGLGFWLWRIRRDRFGTAEAVLADRYARGEITEDEYRERLTVLKRRG